MRGGVSAETSEGASASLWCSLEGALDLPFTVSMVIPRKQVGCGRRSAVLLAPSGAASFGSRSLRFIRWTLIGRSSGRACVVRHGSIVRENVRTVYLNRFDELRRYHLLEQCGCPANGSSLLMHESIS